MREWASGGQRRTAPAVSPGQGAERAQLAGIPVFTVALGTDAGTIVAGPPGQEQVIPVPPDRETLGAIATRDDDDDSMA